MATRLYLPASGTPQNPGLGVSSFWDVSDVVRLPTATVKTGTALATRTIAWAGAASADWVWWQFQTPQITKPITLTTSHTFSMVIGKCGETTVNGDTNIAMSLRVVGGDGVTKQVLLESGSGTEFAVIASAATRIFSAVALAADFACSVGDYLVLEVGVSGTTPALENIQMRIGDPVATADFALTTALTTDLDPWFELSADVEFDEAFYQFHYVNNVTNGTSAILRPLQSSQDVTLTVAVGQLIPICSKRKVCTAGLIGIVP